MRRTSRLNRPADTGSGPNGSLNFFEPSVDTSGMPASSRSLRSLRRPLRRAAGETRDRGATLVEAAIVMPLLMLIIFGILEMGMLFRNYLSVTQLTRDGARAASAYGRDYDADFRTISAIKNTVDVITSGDVKRVVIFDATQGREDARVPAKCLTADPTIPGSVNPAPANLDANIFKHDSELTSVEAKAITRCNIFTPDTWLDAARYGCDDLGNVADDPDFDLNWCPFVRDVSAKDGTDYVGIYVEMEHQWVTGLFGDTRTITETMIMRLEPKEF